MTNPVEVKLPYISRKQFSVSAVILSLIYLPAFFYAWKLHGTHYPFRTIGIGIKHLVTDPAYGISVLNLLTGTFLIFLVTYMTLVYLRNNDIIGKSVVYFSVSLFVGTIMAVAFDKTMLTAVVLIHLADLLFCVFKPGVFSDGAKPNPIWGNKAQNE